MYTQKTESFAYDCVKMFIVFTLNELGKLKYLMFISWCFNIDSIGYHDY